jgi:hypothetical protein
MAAGPAPAPPKAVEAALAAINQPYDARAIRTWVGMARGGNGRTRVTFVWEPKRRVAGDRPGSGAETPERVSLVGVGSDGVPFFSGDLALMAAPGGQAAATTFEAPTGGMQLRLSVEGPSSTLIDAETRVVDVPDFSLSGHALGTPRVLRARTFAEYRRMRLDPDAMPTAAREFSRMDRVIVRVPAYGPAGAAPSLTVRLLGQSGRAIATLDAVPSGSPDEQDVDVPVGSLAPGEYVVEIAMAGDRGGMAQVVALRIVP